MLNASATLSEAYKYQCEQSKLAGYFQVHNTFMEDTYMASKKFKLQFVVSEEDFCRFEEIRKRRFSSTSKQHLLSEMFHVWMHRMAEMERQQ